MEPKYFWESKTFWIALAQVILSFEPTFQSFASEHPGTVTSAVAIIFLFLRFQTGAPLKLK